MTRSAHLNKRQWLKCANFLTFEFREYSEITSKPTSAGLSKQELPEDFILSGPMFYLKTPFSRLVRFFFFSTTSRV